MAKEKAAAKQIRGTRFHCTCQHEFQDKQYGKGIRVWTIGNKVRRCTVCSKEVGIV